jgi:general secretion pathway protein J
VTKHAPDGFTLVEMLVAMALLALLSMLLLGGLRISRNAVIGSEAASERLMRAELALGVIRRELERADPLPLGTAADPPHIAFAGDAQSVVFIAPPGAFLALGGEEITWLAIERGPERARVVLRFRPLDRAGDRWPPALDARDMQSVVLLDDVANADLAYFGRVAPTGDPQWWPEWHDAATLPTLIRLEIAGGGQTWPDLVVTPRIGKPLNSGLLPGGALCRRGAAQPC